MQGSLALARRAGEAMATDVLDFRATGGHIARVTDRTPGGVKLELALVSCHYGFTRGIVGPIRLLVSRTGFIGGSCDSSTETRSALRRLLVSLDALFDGLWGAFLIPMRWCEQAGRATACLSPPGRESGSFTDG